MDEDAARNGYFYWGPMALAIFVFEILGIGWVQEKIEKTSGITIDWPTISTTVGHLEEQWGLVSVAVVGLIAVIALHALQYRNPKDGRDRPATMPEVSETTAQGRRLSHGRAMPRDGNETQPFRFYTWYIGLLVAGTAVFAGVVLSEQYDDRYSPGYLIYGAFLIYGVVGPTLLTQAHKRAQFPTAFFTFRSLRAQFPPIATVLIAGLAILVLHLALYPWPSITNQPSRHAGLKAAEAKRKAETEIERLGAEGRLSYSAQIRGIEVGHEAWLVYFSPKKASGLDSACVVVVTADKGARAKPEC